MKSIVILAATVGAVVFVTAAEPFRAQPARGLAARTVWDSVYTDSQATRGDSLYKVTCAKCHGAALAGGDDGAPLTGSQFLSNWNNLTIGDLFDRVRTSMPPDNPKSVPRPQLADILAYVLAQNHFPAGKAVLSSELDSLKQITIAESKP